MQVSSTSGGHAPNLAADESIKTHWSAAAAPPGGYFQTNLANKSRNKTDVPHDYLALRTPLRTCYLKLENQHMPTGKFALSGRRIGGLGSSSKPLAVKDFVLLRTATDQRSAWLKWAAVDAATSYNIPIGLAPGQLYSCAGPAAAKLLFLPPRYSISSTKHEAP